MSNVKFVEKTAKTVEEAIGLALEELNVSREESNIEVLDEGNKGILGIIGNRLAKVKVSVKSSLGTIAADFLSDILSKMNIDANIEIQEDEKSVMLKVTGDDIGILIGRRGETLDSLQYLTSLVINKSKEGYKRVILDIENYRHKREETLEKLAFRLADRVIKFRKPISLEPMNPFERRIIHACLQNDKFVQTYSVGEEPNRKIIIELKSK